LTSGLELVRGTDLVFVTGDGAQTRAAASFAGGVAELWKRT
jgi:hypothetical protein